MSTYRVSHVEAFRRFERDEDAEIDDLLASIRGEGAGSEAMRVGTAFHRALELASFGDFESLEANGYRFTFDGNCELMLPMVREVRASKTWMVDDAPITISGQVDAIDGKLVIDHKTTARFDPERYIAGCQWKLYLEIFGAQQFRWTVFEIQEIAAELGSGEQAYVVTAQHRLEQFRYPALEADCQALVERFARFVRERLEVPA